MTFNWITGGRGTGKTYGVFDYCIKNNLKFIYLRRTTSELEAILMDESLNPFKKYNYNNGTDYYFKKASKYTYSIINRQDDSKSVKGLAAALSTFANIRGFQGDDFDVLFYDEFIPETHIKQIRDEHTAFLNVYETINRNRELEGKKPLLSIGCSNSNRLDNNIFLGLKLVSKAVNLANSSHSYAILQQRLTMLVHLKNSPISEKKSQTAVYTMAKGLDFEAMSIDNTFLNVDTSATINAQNLREYKPISYIGEICIYKHKSKHLYYISEHVSGAPKKYQLTESDLLRFKREQYNIWLAYLNRQVIFENRVMQILFEKYYK